TTHDADQSATGTPVRADGQVRKGGRASMTSESEDESVRVLDQGDAVELLAYLVTAARTQVDEAPEYAPMRLLTAAGRLAELVEPSAGAGLRPLLRDIRQDFWKPAAQAGDQAGYVERLAALCRTVAKSLVPPLARDRPP